MVEPAASTLVMDTHLDIWYIRDPDLGERLEVDQAQQRLKPHLIYLASIFKIPAGGHGRSNFNEI